MNSVFGSDYGTWSVNLDLLNEESIVYSVGVGKDVTFEHELLMHIDLNGIVCFDPTASCIDWWYNNTDISERLVLVSCAIGDSDKRMPIYRHVVDEYQTESILPGGQWKTEALHQVEVKTIKTAMNALNHKDIDYLKLCCGSDIEYHIIMKMIDDGIMPNQLAYLQLHWNQDQKNTCQSILRSVGYRIKWEDKAKQRVRYELCI